MKQLISFLLLLLCPVGYAQQQDSVTSCGQVIDYKGQSIDSCLIFLQNPSFNVIKEAITNDWSSGNGTSQPRK